MKVLFIGNSQMRSQNLPDMIQKLSESAPEDFPRIESCPYAAGGKTLKLHWEAGEEGDKPRALIKKGGWDKVVIQEIYSAPEDEFRKYAELFDNAVKEAGSQTIFFATANVTPFYREEFTFPQSFKDLNDMQIKLGREKNIPVAPAGYAWLKYLGENSSEEELLDLYAEDRGHPGFKGSYIYACLLYAVLTGKTPVGLTSKLTGKDGETLTEEEALKMQQAAWEQYQKTL
ncbi:MAG: hypothetical protein ACYTFY_09020 [Planctomycetota bacterium]|jgi:hypothetical protein